MTEMAAGKPKGKLESLLFKATVKVTRRSGSSKAKYKAMCNNYTFTVTFQIIGVHLNLNPSLYSEFNI